MNCNKSNKTVKQNFKAKTGPKSGEALQGIMGERRPVIKVFLISFLKGDMGVNPLCGTATLCRYLTELKIFRAANGKPLSYNTIKEDITEIKKEGLLEESLKKVSKNSKNK